MVIRKKATIKFAEDFSRFPTGRCRGDGKASGQEFREEFGAIIARSDQTVIDLDGVVSMAPSFSEEAFGGLVRDAKNFGLTKQQMAARIVIISDEQPTLAAAARHYIEEMARIRD